MKVPIIFLGLAMGTMMATAIAVQPLSAQAVAVKSWHGYYPEMNERYPLSFIAFKGWLFPVPHRFIRSWPTYYYVEAGALPVSDGVEYAGRTQTGLLRIAARLLEKYQVSGRMDERTQTKNNMQLQQEIARKLFAARSDELPDIYGVTEGIIQLYTKINRLKQLEGTRDIRRIMEREADDLLTRFLMINLLQADHGEKLAAFGQIREELSHQLGETDYTFRKIWHFQFFQADTPNSYAFLSHSSPVN